MSDEKSQQQTSTESTVAGAAKTGKAISNIAKSAAAGGAHGAAIEAGKSSAKWLIPLIAAVLLPLILVAMLPSIIFGSLLGDGTDSPNGISNDEVLVQNMTAINEGISSILSEGLTDVLERIDSDFASSGCDGKEINNPFGVDVVFNANAFVSQYCAHKDTDIASISKEDIKLLFEAAERYILVGVLIYTAPVAFATGASENTSNVFSAWCRMLGGQLFLLIMNAWCLRLFTSMVGSFLANPLSV